MVQLTFAQTSTATASALPRLVRFGGTVKDLDGSPLPGLAGITFALYSEQTGGAPLWMETQNLTADSDGHYTALLGATKSEGLPAELFNSEQARWVGVQVQGQPEQPRVLLVSAPYALKAGDAETIGGLPPSAFVLAAPPASGSAAASDPAAIAAGARDLPATATDVTTNGGTADYLPLFTGAATILDSVVFQSGTGATAKIGINIATPATTLDVRGAGTIRGALSLPASGLATATAGAGSQPLNMTASAFNTTAAVSQTFRLQAEPVGNDTAAPSGALSLLYGSGTTAPAATGLTIASSGQITFATGQTFPGAGTITGITTAAGSGLIGGGTSGTPSLGLLTTCAANQVLAWNGSAWACATVGGGTVTSVATGPGLLGGPITTAGTLTIDSTVVPTLGAATNTFTGNIAAGNVNVTTGFQLQGYPFDYGSPFVGSGAGNSLLGFAGNQKMTGGQNVGVGWAALLDNTTGADNTAIGLEALDSNTFGIQNTAVGESALFSNSLGFTGVPSSSGNTAVGYAAAAGNTGGFYNTALGYYALAGNATGDYNTANGFYALDTNTTGNFNTAIGYQAGPSTNNLSNTTAIGSGAAVGESNALVLGGTGPNAVNVGIGTPTPQYMLDVHGTGNFTGNVTFAATQTFPGTGTISGVVAGTGLTGGGSGGSVTLNVNTALIPQLGAANTFTGNQNVNGYLVVSASTLGVLGESSATSGQAEGVAGLAASPSGYGVEGLNDSAGGGAGVYGSSASSNGYGVEGVVTASSGGTGMYGTAPSYGVQGIATGSGSTVGVYGAGRNGVQGNGTANGVSGNGTAAGSTGVNGTGSSYGVQGTATGAGATAGVLGTGSIGLQGNGTAIGVLGNGTAAGSTGVYGSGSNYGLNGVASGTSTFSSPTGVYGLTTSPTGYGVEGQGPVSGVYGVAAGPSQEGQAASTSYSGYGVWGDTGGGDNNAAVLGTADAGAAGAFYNNSASDTTLVALNYAAGTWFAFLAGAPGAECGIYTTGSLQCEGSITDSVPVDNGARTVALYSMQSPENWFEDFGSGVLSNGAATIPLDPTFAQTVNTGTEYHVFLTPRGECEGLYVGATTANGFEVHELHHGTSNAAFDYRIVAKRAGYENVRLADVTDRFNKQAAPSRNMRPPARPAPATLQPVADQHK
jgi:hypothetical protein